RLQCDWECSKTQLGIRPPVKLLMKQHLLPILIVGLAVGRWCPQSGAQVESGVKPARTDPDALRQAAMNNSGNPERGKAMFAWAARQCATCHKVHGKGGDVGPDLSQVGGKFDRTHLIESILNPSAEILQGYQATIIETKSGRSLTGIVKSESETSVTLLNAE